MPLSSLTWQLAAVARRSRNCTDFFPYKQKNFAVHDKVFVYMLALKGEFIVASRGVF